MSPTTEPRPGLYLDSTGTLYAAAKTGKPPAWHIQRLQGRCGQYDDSPPFAYEQFPKAVHRGTFKHIPQQPI